MLILQRRVGPCEQIRSRADASLAARGWYYGGKDRCVATRRVGATSINFETILVRTGRRLCILNETDELLKRGSGEN